MEDIVFRYTYIHDYSRHLISQLGLEKEANIDLAENISYKIAGYNVGLDNFINSAILNNGRVGHFLKVPILNKIMHHFREPVEREYEISLKPNTSSLPVPVGKFDALFFASMNNYLNPLLPLAEKNDNYLILLPKEAEGWINFEKIVQGGYEHIFLEDVIEWNEEKIEELSSIITENYQMNKEKILSFKYDLRYKRSLIEKFILEFLPKHIHVINGLERFIKDVSSTDTTFYIARERRGLENAVIQIAKKIGCQTNMYIHGMISYDINKRLWVPGRFKNCDNILVWGKHDQDVIVKRQKILNEKIPNIIINGNPFLHKVEKFDDSSILFIGQSFTYKYIPFFHRSLPEEQKMIVRLHPAEKKLIEKFHKYHRENFVIDDLRNNLTSIFSTTNLVLGYSSTGMLEAMYNEIPTLILDFKGLENITNIFKESTLTQEEFSMVSINKDNFREIIKQIFSVQEFREKIININGKILHDFVDERTQYAT